jgi:hypothetical protein
MLTWLTALPRYRRRPLLAIRDNTLPGAVTGSIAISVV